MAEVAALGIEIDVNDSAFLRDVFERGAAKGKIDGKAEGLFPLLERCLGRPVPPGRRKQVMAGTLDRCGAWLSVVLEADSLEGVFTGSRH